jgi:hypothetical protein
MLNRTTRYSAIILVKRNNDTVMENIIKSIENSLQNKNWYSALVLSLILPDICAKLEGSSESSAIRYPKWFEAYLEWFSFGE